MQWFTVGKDLLLRKIDGFGSNYVRSLVLNLIISDLDAQLLTRLKEMVAINIGKCKVLMLFERDVVSG